MIKSYRKKPVVIDAVLWDGSAESSLAAIEFLGTKINLNEDNKEHFEKYLITLRMEGILIKTLEGNMKASVGDYIIKGVKGEFYPCKPDIFLSTYEEVE